MQEQSSSWTTAKTKELWTVQLSTRKEFQLNGEQFNQLKQALLEEGNTMINFGEFGFKTSQIVSWWLESREIINQLEAPKEKELTKEEWEKGREKLKQIKERFDF